MFRWLLEGHIMDYILNILVIYAVLDDRQVQLELIAPDKRECMWFTAVKGSVRC